MATKKNTAKTAEPVKTAETVKTAKIANAAKTVNAAETVKTAKIANAAKTVNAAETAKTAETAEVVKIEDAVIVGKKVVEQTVAATKENVEKASTATLQGYDEATEINKNNMDAMTTATNIWSKGVEELGKAYFAFAQNNIETAVSASKAMMAVKTVNEAIELQSDLTRNSVDQLVAESNKLTELTYKVTNDALAPIQSHMNESFGILAKTAA